MKSVYLTACIVLGLFGCASNQLRETTYRSNLPPESLAREFLQLAEKCWQRNSSMARDGIEVSNRLELKGRVIAAFRRGYGVGNLPEFLVATITPMEGGSAVVVKEHNYAAGTYLNLSADVMRWTSGDLTCNTRAAP